MTIPLDDIRIDGYRLDANLANNLKPESEVLRSMEGAPTLRLVVHDPERELLETGVLIKPHRARKALRGTSWDARLGRTRLVLGGRFYVLAGLDKTGSDITLSFEGRINSRLRHHYKPVSAKSGDPNRGGLYTRAKFIKYKLILVAAPGTAVWSPSLFERQPQEEPEPERVRKGVRVHTGLTIKGAAITREQARNINTQLREADKLDAPVRARLALLVAGIGESEYKTTITNTKSGAKGVNQILPRYWHIINWDDVAGQARVFLEQGFTKLGTPESSWMGAIKLARENPRMTPGAIVSAVEGSDAGGSFYDAHIDEAKEILEAYGTGLADEGGATTEKRSRHVFRAGGKKGTPEEENYLAAIDRLIRNDVGWRAFEDDNLYFLAHDLDFLKSTPRVMIAEQCTRRERQIGVMEVGNIDFPFHIADDNSRATFTAPAEAWYGWPGSVIEVIRCGPMAGKHLMWEFRQPILSQLADITLHRPTPPLKEPAPDVNRVSTTEVGATPTEAGDLIYPLAKRGTLIGTPGAGTHSFISLPNNWQSDNALDIGVPNGTKVFAVADGTIVKVSGSYSGGASRFDGFQVTLKTADNQWFYTHLSSCRVNAGDTVEAGQLLGKSGSANGVPHLHIGSERGNPQVLLDWGT